MKRKTTISFLSVALSILMLFSLLQIVPFRVAGDSVSSSVSSIRIDFDSASQPDFYSSGAGHAYGVAVEEDFNSGTYARYSMIKPCDWTYHNALALSNADGTDVLTTRTLDTLQFSADIKAEKINEGLTAFIIGIAYIKDDVAENLSGALNKWTDVGNRADIVTINRSELLDKEWHTFTGEFTVPAHNIDEHPYIFLHQEVTIDGTEDWNNNTVYLDNIVINQPEAEKSGVTDFDSNEQKKFYTLESTITGVGNSEQWQNITKQRGGLKELTGEDAEHGTVYAVKEAAQVGGNWAFWDANKAAAVCLGNTMGTARLHPDYNDEISITAEVKNTKPGDQDIRIGLVFDDYAGNDVGAWDKGLLEHAGRLYELGKVDMSKTDWQSLSKTFTVPYINAETETPKLVLYTTNDLAINDLEIYIDNITVETTPFDPAYFITFDSNGGNKCPPLGCLSGLQPTLLTPVKEGFYFEGWYVDRELTERYLYDAASERDITLYAKWTALESIQPEKLVTGFEKEDYDSGAVPYTNQVPDAGVNLKNPASDNSNTDSVRWLANAPLTSSTGNSCLFFDNAEHQYDGTGAVHAAAVFNSDGTNYKIVSGTRYHVICDVWYDGTDSWDAHDQVTAFAVANTIPSAGLNNNVTVLQKITHDYSPDGTFKFINNPIEYGTWNTCEFYLEAPVTGNLFLAVYCENGSAYRIAIDNLSIIPANAEVISKVTYYEEDGTTVIGSSFGKSGNQLIGQMAPKKSGYLFDSWKTEDGTSFTLPVYPDRDISLTASYRQIDEIDPDTTMDWSRPVTYSFEDTDNVRSFYGDYQNISDPPSTGLYPVFNDAANAHSGNNYFYMRRTGTWLPQGQNRRFRIYAEDTPNHYIWLDKSSVYKLTYYIKVDSHVDSVSRLYAVGFHSPNDLSEYERFDYVQYRCANDIDVSGYHKVEQFLITPATTTTTLGFELWGGLLTCCIDDITVEKLDNVTVRFNSNGGSSVADITTMAMESIVEPEYPTKAGYEFAGWFTDEALSSPFDFNSVRLENDITLYAKWKAAAEESKEPEKQYRTVTDTMYVDENVENEVTDPELDETINITGKDEPAKISKNSNTPKSADSEFPWVIFAIIAGIILLLAAGIILIVVKKRKALK